MGEAWLSFSEISDKLGQDLWVSLFNEVNGSGSHVMGELCIRIDVQGPNQTRCPKCQIYIGEEAMLIHKKARFHTSCVVCERCHLRLREKEYLEKDNLFYCHRDYERIFGSEEYKREVAENNIGLFVPSPIERLQRTTKK